MSYPEGAARLLFLLRIPRLGMMGFKLDRLDDLELVQDLLLGVRSKDGEPNVSSPCLYE